MIVETTIAQLVANTAQIDTSKRQHVANEVQFTGGLTVVSLDDNTVLIKAITSNGYRPAIKLPTIEDDTSRTIIVFSDGTQLAIKPVSKSDEDIHVTCNCKDFVYRFAGINTKRSVLFGKIERFNYIRKTNNKRTTTEYLEPAVCKHLLKLVRTLQAQRIVV